MNQNRLQQKRRKRQAKRNAAQKTARRRRHIERQEAVGGPYSLSGLGVVR